MARLRAAPWTIAASAVLIALVLGVSINWVYEASLQSRADQIALLQRERDDYKEKLSATQKDLEGQKLASQERHIPPDVAAQIVDRLKAEIHYRIRVTYATGDKASARYADNIVDILRRGGWQVEGPAAEYYFGSVFDLSILVGRKADQTAPRLLASIFRLHGINVDVNNTNGDNDQCDLIVGAPSR